MLGERKGVTNQSSGTFTFTFTSTFTWDIGPGKTLSLPEQATHIPKAPERTSRATTEESSKAARSHLHELLHHLSHLDELLHELVNVFDLGARAQRDTTPTTSIEDLVIASLLWSHRENDRLDALKLGFLLLGVDLFRDLIEPWDHSH